MKRMLIAAALAFAAAGQAFAADLPPPAPPPPPPRAPATYVPVVGPMYNWSGVYFGINGGYGFGSSTFNFPTGTPGCSGCTPSNSPNGFLVGGTVGANYQIGGFVMGVEGDLDWADLDGKTACFASAGPNCETKSDFLGTVRGRAGWAWDRVLFFGTAGGAAGNIKAGTNGQFGTGAWDSSDKFGWTAGAGIEAAFAQNWTAKIEYLYVDLGSGACNVACGVGTPGGPLTSVNVSLTENVVRAGVNYKFSW
jgi:outer membrane immunogenic protein